MGKYQPFAENGISGGTQRLYKFPNGFGASVVNHSYSYGTELAVLQFTDDKWDITYNTPVTDDVIGHLDESEVEDYLAQIEALPQQPQLQSS